MDDCASKSSYPRKHFPFGELEEIEELAKQEFTGRPADPDSHSITNQPLRPTRSEVHDLNNLIMTVIGTADLLLRNAELSPLSETRLHRIREAASRAREILSPRKVKKEDPRIKAVEKLFLVVEDESLVLDLAAEILEDIGYTVIKASDGEMAVELFREQKERLSGVLLDLGIPKLDGQETLRRLNSLCPDVPVILTSGYPEQELVDNEHFPSYAAFIQKPYFPRDLVEKVKEVLG